MIMVGGASDGRRGGHAHSRAGDSDLLVHQNDLGAVGHEAFILHAELKKKADVAGTGADKNGSGCLLTSLPVTRRRPSGEGCRLTTTDCRATLVAAIATYPNVKVGLSSARVPGG
jgi:hypothetical protein